MDQPLPYRISTLIYLENPAGELLLLERRKPPNAGFWSPVGGKLEMATGESPLEAARREVAEEVGIQLADRDLHLFAMVAEKNYEARCHWLMFLYYSRVRLAAVPPEHDEGRMQFFDRAAIAGLSVPDTDRVGLWPVYWANRQGFTVLRADCQPGQPLEFVVEQTLGGGALPPVLR
jgi:8-oxo-dGTP diphosphatase